MYLLRTGNAIISSSASNMAVHLTLESCYLVSHSLRCNFLIFILSCLSWRSLFLNFSSQKVAHGVTVCSLLLLFFYETTLPLNVYLFSHINPNALNFIHHAIVIFNHSGDFGIGIVTINLLLVSHRIYKNL